MEYWRDSSKSDFDYFKEWLEKKIKWLIVDGHNRKVALADFLDGKVPLPCSYYDIELVTKDGKTLRFTGKIDSNNNTFDTCLLYTSPSPRDS